MIPWAGFGLGGALIGLAALLVWIVVLVWLAERVLRFIGLRTGWRPLNWRNMTLSVVILAGAIHVGNFLIDWIEATISGTARPFITFPSAFLIGSVAIAVGIAAIRWQRRQNSNAQDNPATGPDQ